MKVWTSLAMDGAVSTVRTLCLWTIKETADDESREASLYVKDENTFYAKNGSSGKWQKQSTTDSMKKTTWIYETNCRYW